MVFCAGRVVRPAVPEQQLAAACDEGGQVRIGRRDFRGVQRSRASQILVQVELHGVPVRIADDLVAPVVRDPPAQTPIGARYPAPVRENLFAGARIDDARVDRARSRHLGGRETRRRFAGGARECAGIECAASRILHDAIGDAVAGVARRDRSLSEQRQLRRSEPVLGMGDELLHRGSRRHQRNPVVRGGASGDAVEVFREALCLLEPLSSAGRAAHPIGATGGLRYSAVTIAFDCTVVSCTARQAKSTSFSGCPTAKLASALPPS